MSPCMSLRLVQPAAKCETHHRVTTRTAAYGKERVPNLSFISKLNGMRPVIPWPFQCNTAFRDSTEYLMSKTSFLLGVAIALAPVTVLAVDGQAVLGSAIGAAAGTAIGSEIGGRNGAVVGGAIGGATGASVGSNHSHVQTQTQVNVQSGSRRYDDDDEDGHRGRRHHHHDNGHHYGEERRDRD